MPCTVGASFDYTFYGSTGSVTLFKTFLFCCSTALLFHCYTALLLYYSTVNFFSVLPLNFFTVLLFYCSTALLHYCSTAPVALLTFLLFLCVAALLMYTSTSLLRLRRVKYAFTVQEMMVGRTVRYFTAELLMLHMTGRHHHISLHYLGQITSELQLQNSHQTWDTSVTRLGCHCTALNYTTLHYTALHSTALTDCTQRRGQGRPEI